MIRGKWTEVGTTRDSSNKHIIIINDYFHHCYLCVEFRRNDPEVLRRIDNNSIEIFGEDIRWLWKRSHSTVIISFIRVQKWLWMGREGSLDWLQIGNMNNQASWKRIGLRFYVPTGIHSVTVKQPHIYPLWQDLEINPLPLSICVWPSRSADSNAYWKVHPFDIKKRSQISYFRWAGLRRWRGKRTVVSAIASTVTSPGGAKSKTSSSPMDIQTPNTFKPKHHMWA